MAQLVGKGDHTTTEGYVLGASSTYFDEGRRMSRHGDLATCGNCEGAHPIYGTASTWLDEGGRMVKHRDRVMCPCGKNFVIARLNSGYFVFDGGSDSSARTPAAASGCTASSASAIATVFDEQVQAVGSGASEGYPYFIETADGETFSGRVDAAGRLPRISTQATDTYTIYWGDEALAHGDES